MNLLLGLPKAKEVKIGKAIQVEDEAGLIIPEKNLPMKLYTKVVAVQADEITLCIPESYWGIVDFQEGLKLLIIKMQSDKIFYTEGRIASVDQEKKSIIKVNRLTTAICAERRLFYRFDIRRYFKLKKVVYPDGATCDGIKAVCQDMSPGGVGFKTKVKLEKGTRFTPADLLDPVMPAMESVDFYMEVLWSKGNKLLGYRNGAIFKFSTKQEQDRFAWVLDQLQVNRLSWYYHNLEKPESSPES